MAEQLKLNLGCGQNLLPGYVNVDKYGDPDVCCDLEVFPWIWETNSVDEVLMNHVLEHLGETTSTYLGIIKELYRVCQPNAQIRIAVPHPRHDDFLNDPTHVRAVTPASLVLFSKNKNLEWSELGIPNSPLGLYLDVDFELERTMFVLDEPWFSQYTNGELSEPEIAHAVKHYNNVIKQIDMELRVIKA